MGNVIHRGKGSFTHVENTVFFDRELSLKAKGIYCQIRSLEGNPEWVFTIRGFASLVKDGVDSVSAGIKEVGAAGYVIRARKRGEAGRFLKAEEATWITLDDPAMHDAVAEELRMEYLKGLLGSVQAVLFEENQGEYATGHAPNYCKVYVKTDENWHNEVKNVRITGLYQDGLTGEAE